MHLRNLSAFHALYGLAQTFNVYHWRTLLTFCHRIRIYCWGKHPGAPTPGLLWRPDLLGAHFFCNFAPAPK